MKQPVLRLRSLADRRFGLLVGGLFVLALLGGYLTYAAYAAPPMETETRQVTNWESTGEFSHRATVVNGSEAFAAGTVLRDRPAYFLGATPTLDGTFEYGYTTSDGGEIDAEVSLSLVLRSVEAGNGGNATVYWQVEDQLASDRVRSIAPGERLDVPFSLDVSEATDRADRIESELGGSPGQLEVAVVARVDLDGTRNGQPVERSREYRLPVEYGQGVYQVADPGPVVASGGRTEQLVVPADPGPIRRLGGPLLLLVGLLGAAGLSVARHRGSLGVTEVELESLSFATAREEFDEWITTARLPATEPEEPIVVAESLADLVDLAIDTNRRVIEDREGGLLVVFDERFTYVYEPPEAAEQGPSTGGPADVFERYPPDDTPHGDERNERVETDD